MADMGLSAILAIGSLAMSGVSTVAGMAGSAQQAQAQANAARQQQQAAIYQAQVAANAQKVAEWQAEDALKRGKIAEEERRTKTRLQIGQQRAALASMGADINDGSNVDIIGDTAAVGEKDALTIRSNADRDAFDRRLVAANYGGDAAMQTYAARTLADRANSYEANSWIGVGSNLLAGASTVADKWSMYRSKGVL